MAKICKPIWLEPEQVKAIEKIQREEGSPSAPPSFSQVVRELVAEALKSPA